MRLLTYARFYSKYGLPIRNSVHMDIQPANILVFPHPDKSPFDVDFKLADFGTSAMRRVETDGTIAIDAMNEGNRMYCEY